MLPGFLKFLRSLTPTDWTAIVGALVGILSLCLNWIQKRAAEKSGRSQVEMARQAADLAERSAKAAEQSAWSAKEGMMVSQRPWVTISDIDLCDWEQPLARIPLCVRVLFRNGGKTPALNARAKSYFRVGGGFSPTFNGEGEHELYFGVVGPEVQQKVLLNLCATDDQRAAFLDGRAIMYTFGQVTYEDLFGHEYVYNWGYVYKESGGLVHADTHGGIIHSLPSWECGGVDI